MRLWFALLVMLSLFASSPAAAGTRLRAPSGVVRAGDVFEVRWEGLPEYVHEAELEMSLDGGRWVRISPEIHSLEGSYRWTIPNSPAARVQVRLRCGGEHREEVAAVSSEFRIVAGGAASARTDFLGEWWSALEPPGSRATRAGALDAHAPFFAEHFARGSAEAPTSVSLGIPAGRGEPLHSGAHRGIAPSPRRERGSRPDFVPLRN